MMLPSRTYLRPDEVANFLSCSERHVRRLCESGKLYAHRIGEGERGPIRVRRDSVLAYVKALRRRYELEHGIFDVDSTDQADP